MKGSWTAAPKAVRYHEFSATCFAVGGIIIQDNEPKTGQRTPMEKLAQNIQEAFLNNARKDKTFLTIYLMSGVKLSGRIKSFDKYSVVLETNNQEQLIFKHAISTVVVSKPFHASAGHSSGASGVAASAGASHPAPAEPVED